MRIKSNTPQIEDKQGNSSKIQKISKSISTSLRRIANLVGGISLKHFRSPTSIFWLILYPILLVLVFGAIFGRSAFQTLNLDIANFDGSIESEDFIGFLDNTRLSIHVIDETIFSPEDWLKDNNKYILLVIPSGWGEKISQNNTANLTVYYDPASYSANTIIEILEESIIELNVVLLPIDIKFGLDIEYNYVEGLTVFDSVIPGIIMIAISTITIFTGIAFDLEERQSGILYRLATTPGYKFELIISKQIWHIFQAFIASTLVILFALLFGFNSAGLHPLMIILVLFGVMTFSGITMLLIRLIQNNEGIMFASILLLIPQILLSGTLISLSEFPQFLQYLSRIFPLYYLTEGMRYLMLNITHQPFWSYFSISAAIAVTFSFSGFLATKWRKE